MSSDGLAPVSGCTQNGDCFWAFGDLSRGSLQCKLCYDLELETELLQYFESTRRVRKDTCAAFKPVGNRFQPFDWKFQNVLMRTLQSCFVIFEARCRHVVVCCVGMSEFRVQSTLSCQALVA